MKLTWSSLYLQMDGLQYPKTLNNILFLSTQENKLFRAFVFHFSKHWMAFQGRAK